MALPTITCLLYVLMFALSSPLLMFIQDPEGGLGTSSECEVLAKCGEAETSRSEATEERTREKHYTHHNIQEFVSFQG